MFNSLNFANNVSSVLSKSLKPSLYLEEELQNHKTVHIRNVKYKERMCKETKGVQDKTRQD